MTEDNNHAREASIRHTRRVMAFAVTAVLAGMALLVVALLYVISVRTQTAQRICKAQIAQTTALRGVLEIARTESLRTARTPDEAERVGMFYRRLLKPVPRIECDNNGTPHPLPEPKETP